jgi:hypothetical protein
MAALRVARLGAATGPGRGGVDAPRRSTTATTEPATMVTARVPATSSGATERRHGAGVGGAGRALPGVVSRAPGATAAGASRRVGVGALGGVERGSGRGSPTHTPKGGG